jgi:hypothetical protein
MATLITRPIIVRGETYEVSELDGKTMAQVRTQVKSGSEETDLFIAFKALVNPKPKSKEDLAAWPNLVVKSIAAEAMRLTAAEDPDAKPGEVGDAVKKD